MFRFTRFAAILALFVLVLPAAAQSEIFNDASGTPISADNAADVVPLARYGRGTAAALAWSPDGTTLAVGGSAGIWLYRVTDFDGDVSPLVGHSAPVTGIAFNGDGSRLVSGGSDSSLRVWDTEAGELLQTLEVPYSATFSTIDYAPDDSLIVTADLNTLLVWNAESGELQNQLTIDPINSVVKAVFAPDDLRVALLTENGGVTLWDVTAGTQTLALQVAEAAAADAAWSPDGASLFVTISSGSWQQYDTATGELIGSGGNGTVTTPDRLTRSTLSNDGTTMAVGDTSGVIQFWNLATGEPGEQRNTGSPLVDLAYSRDGSVLAALNQAGALLVWDTATLEATVELVGYHQGSSAGGAVFNADASQIAAGYLDNTGMMIDPETGEFSAPFTGTGKPVHLSTMAFSPDGTVLAVSDGFGISLKDAASGEQTAYLNTLFAPVFAWSQDGTVIAAGDSTGTLSLWDTGGTLLMSRTDNTLSINSVVFSADGSLILTASGDGTVRLYGIAD